MIIDCDTCQVRGPACGDCVVSVILRTAPQPHLDADEQRALTVLADCGLVPPLRMVPMASTGGYRTRGTRRTGRSPRAG